MPVSANLISKLKLRPLRGGDGLLYLFRVTEMMTYLSHALGASPIIASKNFDTAFAGKRGIVTFTVKGWSNASGHVALWDGSAFKEPTYDDYRFLRDNTATPAVEAETTRMALWPL